MSQDSDPAPPVPPVLPEEASPPPPRPRLRRRNVLIVSVTAAAMAGVVTIGVVTVPTVSQPTLLPVGQPAVAPAGQSAVAPAGQSPPYAGMPAPCALIPAATVARYVTGAASAGQGPSTSGTTETGACIWSGLVGDEAKTLIVQVSLYRSASAVIDAESAYNDGVPIVTCSCNYDMQPVAGLGDVAQAGVHFAGSSSTFRSLTVSAQPIAWSILEALSGNVDVFVSYDITPYQVGGVASLPSAAADIAAMTAAAHAALDALAHPAAVPAAPPSVTPRYGVSAQPCDLVSMATLSRYLPLPSVTNSSSSQAQHQTSYPSCGWADFDTGVGILVSAGIYKSAGGAMTAEQVFPGYAYGLASNSKGDGSETTTEETNVVTGIGNQALAFFQTFRATSVAAAGPIYDATLVIWSGNADLTIQFSYGPGQQSEVPVPPPRGAQLSALITVARDVLANLPRS